MPDNKNLSVVGYAVASGLCAVTLFYVFSPTFFIDADAGSGGLFNNKVRPPPGLWNSSNDCFINCILSSLAGLGDLRLYLIKEIHRRELDGTEIYDSLPVLKKADRAERIKDLQHGLVTRGLKDIIDALNERPLYKKTISNSAFIAHLERAYNSRISRNQQDAHEFLQIVLERLQDEYKAAQKARSRTQSTPETEEAEMEDPVRSASMSKAMIASGEGFPFEGKLESQIQCMYCGFKTKPSIQTFVSLTLNVPQGNSTTLDRCFDVLLKTEEIDDYHCDRCRLKHALDLTQTQMARTSDESRKSALKQQIDRLQNAIENDPEVEPEGVELPDQSQSPARKIKKFMRITTYPRIIAIHLSRSVYDTRSTKNMAKVHFEERLRLGGILNEHWYRLASAVTHKGSHQSGHYESHRATHVVHPYANPDPFGANSKMSSTTASPVVNGMNGVSPSTSNSTPSMTSANTPNDTQPTSDAVPGLRKTITQDSRQIRTHVSPTKSKRRGKGPGDKWWRISDQEVKQTKLSQVLSMEREVYLLFYTLENEQSEAQLNG